MHLGDRICTKYTAFKEDTNNPSAPYTKSLTDLMQSILFHRVSSTLVYVLMASSALVDKTCLPTWKSVPRDVAAFFVRVFG